MVNMLSVAAVIDEQASVKMHKENIQNKGGLSLVTESLLVSPWGLQVLHNVICDPHFSSLRKRVFV